MQGRQPPRNMPQKSTKTLDCPKYSGIHLLMTKQGGGGGGGDMHCPPPSTACPGGGGGGGGGIGKHR